MFGSRSNRIRRARLVPIALSAAAFSSAVLGMSMTGTLSAFQASITNSSNTASAGSLVMRETDAQGNLLCSSTQGANNAYASCTGVDKYGGQATPFTPDQTHTTTVYIGNSGTSRVNTFTLLPGACTLTASTTTDGESTGDLCKSLQLTLTCAAASRSGVGSATTVYDHRPLSDIANKTVDLGALSQSSCVPAPNAGTTFAGVQFTFSVYMPKDQDNTVQGQAVSQPITWTFTGA